MFNNIFFFSFAIVIGQLARRRTETPVGGRRTFDEKLSPRRRPGKIPFCLKTFNFMKPIIVSLLTTHFILFFTFQQISAEVQNIYSDGAVSLHTRSLKYGKLSQGTLVKASLRTVIHLFNYANILISKTGLKFHILNIVNLNQYNA